MMHIQLSMPAYMAVTALASVGIFAGVMLGATVVLQMVGLARRR